MQQKVIEIEIDLYNIKDDLARIDSDSITFKELGFLITANGRYSFSIENTDFYPKLISRLKTPSEDDIKDKSFYRYPEISLPREKFNMIKEKYNCKLVKDVSSADYEIVSLKTFANMVEWNSNGRSFTVSEFKSHFSSSKIFFVSEAYQSLIDQIDAYNDTDIIIFNFRTPWSCRHASRNSIRNWSEGGDYKSVAYISLLNNTVITTMLNSNRLISDSYMYKFADKHLHTLDEENYKSVIKMIKASNEDRELAIGILSNSNIETSFDKIALIFYFHNEKLKESKGYQTASFKVLRATFKDYVNHNYLSNSNAYNQLIRFLSRDKALTEFAFKESVLAFYNNVVCNAIGSRQDERAFTIDLDAIKLNPKFEKALTKTLEPRS